MHSLDNKKPVVGIPAYDRVVASQESDPYQLGADWQYIRDAVTIYLTTPQEMSIRDWQNLFNYGDESKSEIDRNALKVLHQLQLKEGKLKKIQTELEKADGPDRTLIEKAQNIYNDLNALNTELITLSASKAAGDSESARGEKDVILKGNNGTNNNSAMSPEAITGKNNQESINERFTQLYQKLQGADTENDVASALDLFQGVTLSAVQVERIVQMLDDSVEEIANERELPTQEIYKRRKILAEVDKDDANVLERLKEKSAKAFNFDQQVSNPEKENPVPTSAEKNGVDGPEVDVATIPPTGTPPTPEGATSPASVTASRATAHSPKADITPVPTTPKVPEAAAEISKLKVPTTPEELEAQREERLDRISIEIAAIINLAHETTYSGESIKNAVKESLLKGGFGVRTANEYIRAIPNEGDPTNALETIITNVEQNYQNWMDRLKENPSQPAGKVELKKTVSPEVTPSTVLAEPATTEELEAQRESRLDEPAIKIASLMNLIANESYTNESVKDAVREIFVTAGEDVRTVNEFVNLIPNQGDPVPALKEIDIRIHEYYQNWMNALRERQDTTSDNEKDAEAGAVTITKVTSPRQANATAEQKPTSSAETGPNLFEGVNTLEELSQQFKAVDDLTPDQFESFQAAVRSIIQKAGSKFVKNPDTFIRLALRDKDPKNPAEKNAILASLESLEASLALKKAPKPERDPIEKDPDKDRLRQEDGRFDQEDPMETREGDLISKVRNKPELTMWDTLFPQISQLDTAGIKSRWTEAVAKAQKLNKWDEESKIAKSYSSVQDAANNYERLKREVEQGIAQLDNPDLPEADAGLVQARIDSFLPRIQGYAETLQAHEAALTSLEALGSEGEAAFVKQFGEYGKLELEKEPQSDAPKTGWFNPKFREEKLNENKDVPPATPEDPAGDEGGAEISPERVTLKEAYRAFSEAKKSYFSDEYKDKKKRLGELETQLSKRKLLFRDLPETERAELETLKREVGEVETAYKSSKQPYTEALRAWLGQKESSTRESLLTEQQINAMLAGRFFGATRQERYGDGASDREAYQSYRQREMALKEELLPFEKKNIFQRIRQSVKDAPTWMKVAVAAPVVAGGLFVGVASAGIAPMVAALTVGIGTKLGTKKLGTHFLVNKSRTRDRQNKIKMFDPAHFASLEAAFDKSDTYYKRAQTGVNAGSTALGVAAGFGAGYAGKTFLPDTRFGDQLLGSFIERMSSIFGAPNDPTIPNNPGSPANGPDAPGTPAGLQGQAGREVLPSADAAVAERLAQSAAEAARELPAYKFTIPQDGTVSDAVYNEWRAGRFADVQGLPENRAQFVERMNEVIKNASPELLREMDISSGSIHKVYPDQEINLTPFIEKMMSATAPSETLSPSGMVETSPAAQASPSPEAAVSTTRPEVAPVPEPRPEPMQGVRPPTPRPEEVAQFARMGPVIDPGGQVVEMTPGQKMLFFSDLEIQLNHILSNEYAQLDAKNLSSVFDFDGGASRIMELPNKNLLGSGYNIPPGKMFGPFAQSENVDAILRLHQLILEVGDQYGFTEAEIKELSKVLPSDSSPRELLEAIVKESLLEQFRPVEGAATTVGSPDSTSRPWALDNPAPEGQPQQLVPPEVLSGNPTEQLSPVTSRILNTLGLPAEGGVHSSTFNKLMFDTPISELFTQQPVNGPWAGLDAYVDLRVGDRIGAGSFSTERLTPVQQLADQLVAEGYDPQVREMVKFVQDTVNSVGRDAEFLKRDWTIANLMEYFATTDGKTETLADGSTIIKHNNNVLRLK